MNKPSNTHAKAWLCQATGQPPNNNKPATRLDVAVWAENTEQVKQLLSRSTQHLDNPITNVFMLTPAEDITDPIQQALADRVGPFVTIAFGEQEPFYGELPGEYDDTEYLSISEHDIPPLPEQPNLAFWNKEWIVPELKALLFDQAKDGLEENGTEENRPEENQRKKSARLNTFLVVDAILRRSITKFFDLSHQDVPTQCLFTGKAAKDLEESAPYLIDMSLSDEALNNKDKIPTFHRDFFEHHWEQITGIIIRTTASMDELHHHLRKFTKIQDSQGKWVFFRFWDPRTLDMVKPLRHDAKSVVVHLFYQPWIHSITFPTGQSIQQIRPRTGKKSISGIATLRPRDEAVIAHMREKRLLDKLLSKLLNKLAPDHPALQALTHSDALEHLYNEATQKGYGSDEAIEHYIRSHLLLQQYQQATMLTDTTMADIEHRIDPHREYSPSHRAEQLWQWLSQYTQKDLQL